LVALDRFELIDDFAYPLPVEVFCEMLGIPAEAGAQFRRWTAAVARSLDLVISEEDYDACMAELDEMEAYLTTLADQRRAEPTDDLLSALVHTDTGEGPLTPDELVAQLMTLYVAGHEPTTALIGNGMAALFQHPDQLARLQAAPSLVPAAVQEFLRYDGPNQFVRRIAIEPLAWGEHTIDAGDVIYVGVGAANHDPAQWGADADALRIDRPDAAQHVQFGGGIHHCLGHHLARAQAEVALTALLTRLPDLRPDGDVTWSGRMTLRSVAHVPLAFGP
jgi:cytochrome P450